LTTLTSKSAGLWKTFDRYAASRTSGKATNKLDKKVDIHSQME